MKRIGIWRIGGNGAQVMVAPLQELHTAETEEKLEQLLVDSPDILMPGLTLIGRQLATAGGPLDLIGIDADGAPVLFELKKGTLTRDAVAQILDYAADLQAREPEEFAALIENASGRHGVDRIDDFADWYQGEFPDIVDLPPANLRLVLVGLGTDGRATRVVDYLARAGVAIQLLTFQVFRSGSELLLARHVESAESPKRREAGAASKEENLEILTQRASEHGVSGLLFQVADFVEQLVGGYRWPGKTAVTFSMQELTSEGKPTLRAYVSVWVDMKQHGQVILVLRDRAIECAPDAVNRVLSEVPSAEETTDVRMPFRLFITEAMWPSLSSQIRVLLTEVIEGRRRRSAEQAAEEEHAVGEP